MSDNSNSVATIDADRDAVLSGGPVNLSSTVATLVAIGEEARATSADLMLRRTLAIGDYLVTNGISSGTTRGRGKVLDTLLNAVPDTAGLSKANAQRFARYFLEARDRGLNLTARTVQALNAATDASADAYKAIMVAPGVGEMSEDDVLAVADKAITASKDARAAVEDRPQTVAAFLKSIRDRIESGKVEADTDAIVKGLRALASDLSKSSK